MKRPPTRTSVGDVRSWTRKIARADRYHWVILEGTRAVEEALQYVRRPPYAIFIETGRRDRAPFRHLARQARRRGALVHNVEPSKMARLSTVESPPGILAIWVHPPEAEWPPTAVGYYAYLFQVRDPGNLGTIFRSALAHDIRGLILSPGSVSVYNPKVTRASMSACLRVPFWVDVGPEELLRWSQKKGMPLMVVHPTKPASIRSFPFPTRGVFVLGGETARLPGVLGSLPGFHIPMYHPMDSLNVAMAATIVFYEAHRP